VAHMRSAKVEPKARTVADAAVALRTVPAGRKHRTFLCVHYQLARIPDGTTMPDLQDFRCADALRCDGRRASNWFARASFTSAAESGQCVFLQSVRNSACTVLHQWSHYIRGVTADGLWHTSGGISLRPLTLRCACNSACDGRVAAPVCMPMQWKTRGNHRSVSASTCTMHCGGRS
jgi:hypothetical protein